MSDAGRVESARFGPHAQNRLRFRRKRARIVPLVAIDSVHAEPVVEKEHRFLPASWWISGKPPIQFQQKGVTLLGVQIQEACRSRSRSSSIPAISPGRSSILRIVLTDEYEDDI